VSVSWTLKYNGSTQTLAAWGLGKLSRRLVSQGVDVVSCVSDGSNVGTTPLFALDSTVVIYRDSVIWFTGRVTRVPHSGEPAAESVAYEFSGPWWYLDNKVYQQQWAIRNTGEGSTTAQYKSRVILGQALAGTRQTVAQVITEVLNYAIADGVPLAIGTISPTLQIPFAERVDITCSEAIRTVLRWIPDCVCWFDYSAETPVFHCQRRSELTAMALDLAQGSPNHRIDIAPRPDLQVSAVVLNFEQTNVVNSVPPAAFESITTDKSPADATGRELKALVSTIRLAGGRVTMQQQKITTEAVCADPWTNETWWKARLPFLNDANITAISIHDGERMGHAGDEGDEYYTYELMEGSIHEWMTSEVEEDLIQAYVDYTILVEGEDGFVHEEIVNKRITYRFIATNLATGTYKRVENLTTGESVPSGMAAYIYAGMSQLQYEGSFVLLEEEITGSIGMGNVVNITNGLAEWASMRGSVQVISEDVDSGLTSIAFGFPEQLGPADLMEILRGNRSRVVSTLWAARVSGDPFEAGSTVDEENIDVLAEAGVGGGEKKNTVYRDSSGSYEKTITVDPAEISKEDADVDIKPREIDVCVDGTPMKMQVMCSAPY
jgi:hypothetical protein